MRMLTPYLSNRGLASDLFTEMDRFFDDWGGTSGFHPACEVSETKEHYLMSVDLPGMKKEDIQVEMSDDVLTVSGERKREDPEKTRGVRRHERSYGFFKRSFSFPSSIEADKVEARYENGVLELYLPKTQAAKPRHIEIQAGKSGIFEKLLGTPSAS